MKRFVILAVILTASLRGQVEHAPTVAQCQADQKLWLSKIEEGHREQLPAFRVLSVWVTEMNDCGRIDTANAWTYSNTSGEIIAEQATRTLDFITRYDLLQKFLEEDAAGKR